jgi:hypothetical protein
MGRGTLEQPFNAVTAAIDFVRSKLLPQDYVAVMAYNRATDFTTDHQEVIGVLDSRGLLVGEHRQPLVVTISKDDYEKSLASSLNYTLSIPVRRLPGEVKVIVYDPSRDLPGSASWRSGM